MKAWVLLGCAAVAPLAWGEEPAARFDEVAAMGLIVEQDSPVVAEVMSGSPAARAGLAVGDRIEQPRGPFAKNMRAILKRARKSGRESVLVNLQVSRGGAQKTVELRFTLREIEVAVCVNRGLDFLARESAGDPNYQKTRQRSFYAPIIYAPLAGLAFVMNGSTRVAGRHSAAVGRALDYVMAHGAKRKKLQDQINKLVGGNICSLTHNAGYSAMFLAQLLAAESAGRSGAKLRFSRKEIRNKLGECCRTLEKLALPNGGWQHGSGGANALGYTHLTAATITALNGLGMAKQVGVKVDGAVLSRGLGYLKKATDGGHVGYAVGNKGSFSAGRNAGALQCLVRNGLQKDPMFRPVLRGLSRNLDKAGTGHGSPTWHLFYVSLATAHLDAEGAERFFSLYGKRLLANQQADGSLRALDPPNMAPGKGEENRVWGALYTTPLIAMVLLAPYRQETLLCRFGASTGR